MATMLLQLLLSPLLHLLSLAPLLLMLLPLLFAPLLQL